jgi:predicted metalloprotease
MYNLIVRCLLLAGILAPAVAGADIPGSDLRHVQAKLAQARPYLESVFREFFPNRKPAVPLPPIIPYRGEVVSGGCGTFGPDNAEFCPADNTIYYDEIFLTKLTNSIGVLIEMNSDYAAVVVLAHELGHAIKFRKTSDSCLAVRQFAAPAFANSICDPVLGNQEYDQEAQADCYAGAVSRRLRDAGLIQPRDLLVAEITFRELGDKGWRSDDNRDHIWARWGNLGTDKPFLPTPHSHGEGADRMKNFETGYKGGPNACRFLVATRH